MAASEQTHEEAEVAHRGALLRGAAVFVDYENAKNCGGRTLFPDEIIAAIRNDLTRFGAPSFVNVYMAIGLPESPAPVSNGMMYRVFKAGGTVVPCPSFRNGTDAPKNLADPTAIIDIGESLLVHPEVGCYALATGDKDFIPAIRKLRKYGKQVRLYHGDGLSAHLRDEVLLGANQGPPDTVNSEFSGIISLKAEIERSMYPKLEMVRPYT